MNNDPDPFVHFNGIRIILFNLMQICESATTGLQTLHDSISSLHCEDPRPSMGPFWASTATNFDFDADPASENNADPDPQPCT